MGITTSTSLSNLKDNAVLQRFIGLQPVPQGDKLWAELVTFSYSPLNSTMEMKLMEETLSHQLDTLVKHNHSSGNLRTLVKIFLDQASSLRDESKCESNQATWQLFNSLLIIRLCLKHMIQRLPSEEVLLHLDGSTTVPQLQPTSRDFPSTPPPTTEGVSFVDPLASLVRSAGSGGGGEVLTQEALMGVALESPIVGVQTSQLLSWRLVEGLNLILADIPLLPFTYDIHQEAVTTLIVLLSGQMFGCRQHNAILNHIMSTSTEMANLVTQTLIHHTISRPPPPQNHRFSTGIVSSITSSLWSLVVSPKVVSDTSPLADLSLLLLLLLAHQRSKGHNPFRNALSSFTDEHEEKSSCTFSVRYEKLYHTMCRQLEHEDMTLLLYMLLQKNSNMTSYIFSKSDLDLLVVPLLKQLFITGSQSCHHVYMILIIMLILSQDACFNKSVHEVTFPQVIWYTERAIKNISLGSLMVIVLIRTIQVNMSQIRDKYLHTNCLAALANMSAHFHSLHLEAAQKLINLFKILARKYLKVKGTLNSPHSPLVPQSSESIESCELPMESQEPADQAADLAILEEVLLMVLEIINSCLTHGLHNNPHLVYSLLYQREVFEPFRTHPAVMNLVQNIETVIAFFSSKLEKAGPGPYSSAFVLESISQGAMAWPKNRLRVFPDLKFHYVEEEQPDEFFIPYVWTLGTKCGHMYWDSSQVHFVTTS
eukprot:Em0010g156a